MTDVGDQPSEEAVDEDEAPAFVVERSPGSSPFLITCDHASARLPRRLGTLGLSDEELARHIAWDIGAAGTARALGDRLDATVILQGYSRLAIDANRPPGAPDSIVAVSDGTVIPGNQGLASGEAARRAREIFHPYHDRIAAELDARARQGRATALISMHSFTPSMGGRDRPWHAGVLHLRDSRLAHLLLELLRRDPALVIGDNEPYAASDETDYTIVVHAERRGLPHAELEIRQDLVATAGGQRAWADRLAALLRQAESTTFPR
jgi:predicted N-formylglutamate amidohydrolase